MPCQDGRGHLVPMEPLSSISAGSRRSGLDLGSPQISTIDLHSHTRSRLYLDDPSRLDLGRQPHVRARARTTNISHPTHLPPHPTPSPPLAPSLSPAPWALLPGLCAAGRMGPREIWPRCGRDDSSPLCFGAACSFHTPLHTPLHPPLHTHTLHPFPHLTLRLTPLHTSTPVRRRPRRGV